MSKTKNDVIVAALRHLTVISSDEPAQAEDLAYAGDIYDGIYNEMFYTEELDVGETDEVPDEQFIPFYKLLASDIAPYYGLAGPSRSAAVMSLRAAMAEPIVEAQVMGEYF